LKRQYILFGIDFQAGFNGSGLERWVSPTAGWTVRTPCVRQRGLRPGSFGGHLASTKNAAEFRDLLPLMTGFSATKRCPCCLRPSTEDV